MDKYAEVEARVGATAGLRTTLLVALYNWDGPFVSLKPYLNVEASLSDWTLRKGVAAYVGIDNSGILESEFGGNLFTSPYELFDLNEIIDQGTWNGYGSPTDFEVWGGHSYIYGVDGYNPQNHGYKKLASGEEGELVFAFGSYPYYVIVTRNVAQVNIDAVLGNKNKIPYQTFTDGNSSGWLGVVGDGNYMTIGNYGAGGYILIDVNSEDTNGLTIYTKPK